MAASDEISWHNDGHTIGLQLNNSTVKVVDVFCPHEESETPPCRHADAKCAVRWFVSTYGLECNVGVCAPEERLTIAWTFAGDWHKELEQGQVWIMPINDEAFAAWLATQ